MFKEGDLVNINDINKIKNDLYGSEYLRLKEEKDHHKKWNKIKKAIKQECVFKICCLYEGAE